MNNLNEEQNNIINVCTTFQDIEETQSMIISAIKQKLVMSADYWIVNSLYPWNGIIEHINQYNVSFTTHKDQVDQLIKFIESNHSYQMPFITGYKTDFLNNKYRTWSEKTLHNNLVYLTQEEKEKIEKAKETGAYDKLK